MDSSKTDLPPDLARLEAEAIAIEQVAEADNAITESAPGAPAAATDFVGDARGLINILSDSLAAFYPSTASVITDDKRQALAVAWAPVMEKYGVSMASILGKYGVEIGAAFVTAQIAVPLANAIRADRAAAAVDKVKTAAMPKPSEPSAVTTAAPPASDLYSKA